MQPVVLQVLWSGRHSVTGGRAGDRWMPVVQLLDMHMAFENGCPCVTVFGNGLFLQRGGGLCVGTI